MGERGAPSADDDAKVIDWVERATGGSVVNMTRQPRWRPMWFVDVDRHGALERIVVRGERTDTPLVFPLRHEMRFQRLLEEHGIAVPHVYGWCEEPASFAMSAIPGRPDFAGVPASQRDTIVDEYVQTLVAMHQLPVERFVEADIVRGSTRSDAAHVGRRRFEALYRATKVRPDPLVEFVFGWLDRHPLPPSERMAPIVWDSGQFHHEHGHFLSIMDCELAHLGDPMMDLAAWRMRDTVIPYGDFSAIYDRYAQLSGTSVDMAAIQYHHLMFTLTNQLSFHGPLAKPTPHTDYMTDAQWVSETNLHAIETMAEYLELELEPVEIPRPVATPVSAPHEHLSTSLRSISVDDPFIAYQVRIAFRLARHLERYNQIGAEVAEQDRADVGALTGKAPADWEECESELERFVLADRGQHDQELVQLFNRRWRRYKALMGPEGSAMATHHVMQPLGPSLLEPA
jgi:aminoglycoside phosphotransferase (APT) family kinase protein